MPHTDPSDTAAPPAKISESEARTWMMLCHLAGLAVFIPFGHIIGPLIVWVIKKEDHPEIDRHGREALNFQVSWTIWAFIAGVLWLVFIGIILTAVLGIAWLVLTILAAVKANKGEFYRYPLTIRFF